MGPLLDVTDAVLYSHSLDDRFPVEFAAWLKANAATAGLQSPASLLSIGLQGAGTDRAYAVMRELISSWGEGSAHPLPVLVFDLIGYGEGGASIYAATASIMADMARGRIVASARLYFNLVLIESDLESAPLAEAPNLRLLATPSTSQLYAVVAEFLFGASALPPRQVLGQLKFA